MDSVAEIFAQCDWSTVSTPREAALVLREAWRGDADEARSKVVQTLAEVWELHPNRGESPECPFWAQPLVDALDTSILAALAANETLRKLPDAAFAQLVDVAQYRRVCDYQLVIEASEAYLRAAETALDSAHWLTSYDYVRRAVNLSAQVRRKSPEHAALLDRVAALVHVVGERDPLYFSAKVMGILLDQRYAAGASLAELAGRLAESAATARDYSRAETYFETKIQWHRLYKEKDGDRASAVRIAELLEAHAEERLANDGALVAVHFQAEAVAAWRRVGERGLAEKAHAKLQELQRQSVKGFASYSGEIDLSDSSAQARERVSNKTKPEAVLALAMLSRPMGLARLKDQAKKRLEQFLFYALFPRVSVNAAGRRTHVANSAMAQTPEEQQAALLDEARSDCATNIQFVAHGAILPAAQQVQGEHGITTREMFGLVERSAFVPPKRRTSFARGLALGFQGEFLLAAHLLMPQFENALRAALEARGVVVSSLLPSGIQRELDLGKLLEKAETKTLLGDAEHFEMETLLVHEAGVNLRNQLAHGLFDDGTRHAFLVYFWWKVLRYVVLFTALTSVSEIAVDDDDDPESEDPSPAQQG